MKTRKFYPKQLWRRTKGCGDESQLTGVELHAFRWFYYGRTPVQRVALNKCKPWLLFSGASDQLSAGEVKQVSVNEWPQPEGAIKLLDRVVIRDSLSVKVLWSVRTVSRSSAEGAPIFRLDCRKARRLAYQWRGTGRGRRLQAWLKRRELDSKAGGFLYLVSAGAGVRG